MLVIIALTLLINLFLIVLVFTISIRGIILATLIFSLIILIITPCTP